MAENLSDFREPIAAGTFYAANAAQLRRQIESCFRHPLGPRPSALLPARPLALVSPHAGYDYSGPVAANAYHSLAGRKIERVVLIGPNHRCLGPPFASSGKTFWRTPLGVVPIDRQAAAELSDLSAVVVDDRAHELEHSIEVQLPFLQYVLPDGFRLLPIVIGDQRLDPCRDLGLALLSLLQTGSTLLVASTDFTHYERDEAARQKDRWALRAIESLDLDDLVKALSIHKVTMCGPGAVFATVAAVREQGGTRGHLLRYATSGEVTGDLGYVVGYGALALC